MNSQLVSAYSSTSGVGLERAKEIALGQTDGGQVLKTQHKNGKHGSKYEVVIVKGEMVYEVKLNANDGSVRKFEKI